MRGNRIYIGFLSLFFLAVCYSCSNNESGFEEKSNEKSLIEQKFNASKFNTIGHNVMLESVYNALEKKPDAISASPLRSEMLLDSCLNLFVAANKDFAFSERIGASTRGSSAFPSFSFLKKCILGNCALNDANKLTRSSHEDAIKQPEFLMMFYNEFFNNEDIIRDSLEDEILKTINKVMASYPNLTDEEIDGLFFVAGVTYNSCVYWYENSDKWISVLLHNQKQKTRGWLWDGVKNGTKKWAKADGAGALRAWAMSSIAGVASNGTTLLAGAAVGSLVGAWNNLPYWD